MNSGVALLRRQRSRRGLKACLAADPLESATSDVTIDCVHRAVREAQPQINALVRRARDEERALRAGWGSGVIRILHRGARDLASGAQMRMALLRNHPSECVEVGGNPCFSTWRHTRQGPRTVVHLHERHRCTRIDVLRKLAVPPLRLGALDLDAPELQDVFVLRKRGVLDL